MELMIILGTVINEIIVRMKTLAALIAGGNWAKTRNCGIALLEPP
jgi:hypothetical protein